MQIAKAQGNMQVEITSQSARAEDAQRQATGAASDLMEARRALQDIRAQAFKKFGNEPDVPPPAYRAV
jgi:hypothetical protein